MQQDLEIDLLRAFVTVAEQQSFTRAGSVLGRTQSAVSLQVKRLEAIVNARLFERTKKSVRITANGETLLVYAHRILDINNEALSAIVEPEASGLIKIGAPDDYATHLLPDVLSALSRKHPRIHMEFTSENSYDLLPLFKQGKLDLALVTHPLNEVSGEVLRREKVHWVAAKTFTPATNEPLPLIMYSQDSICRKMAIEALGKMQRPWRIAYSTRSIAVIENAVIAGADVAVMETSIIPKGLKILDGSQEFPDLPDVMICLHCKPGKISTAIELARDHISRELSAS